MESKDSKDSNRNPDYILTQNSNNSQNSNSNTPSTSTQISTSFKVSTVEVEEQRRDSVSADASKSECCCRGVQLEPVLFISQSMTLTAWPGDARQTIMEIIIAAFAWFTLYDVLAHLITFIFIIIIIIITA